LYRLKEEKNVPNHKRLKGY